MPMGKTKFSSTALNKTKSVSLIRNGVLLKEYKIMRYGCEALTLFFLGILYFALTYTISRYSDGH